MRWIVPILFICLLPGDTPAQQHRQMLSSAGDENLIEQLMKANPTLFKHILDHKDSLQVQVVYTQINRNRRNRPVFTEYHFNLNNNKYFYPASTVKMPVAFLALEKLNELKKKGLSKNSTMITDSSSQGQDVVYTHPMAEDGRSSIAHYIKQVFLVSDNDAFNRLYEFLGQEYIQKKLTEKGYPDAIIRHRLEISRTPEQNRNTNPVSFYDTSGQLLYHQDGQYSKAVFPTVHAKLGKGYYSQGKLVTGAFSFVEKNRVYLQDLHHMLQTVLFPESFSKKQRFRLTKEDYDFVYRWMSAYPRESQFPFYDTAQYQDAYCKFLLYGNEKGTLPAHIRIFNKVGDAYGFLTDVAYIVDTENKTEFLLSATILCNSDGIFNDSHYDYDTLGFPFMKNLGQVIYDYEKGRKRPMIPDLNKFTLAY